MIKVNRARLDPMASPYDSIESPFSAEVIATITSGSDVATEMIKKLIVYSDISSVCAILVEESINSFIAFVITKAAAASINMFTCKE